MIPILMLVAAGTVCHAVKGDRITVGDLAAVSPSFAGLAAETVVGYAPQPGSRRTMEPAELLRLAAANNLDARDLSPVCFERALLPLDNAQILSALQSSLNRPDAEIELLEFSKYAVPPGKIVFPVEALPSRASAHIAIWNGYVEFEGRHFPLWARARITVPQTRVVAAVQLRAGQMIGDADVRVEQVRDFPAKAAPLTSAADCVNRAVRRFMEPGAPISPADLMDASDVERGDMVTVQVQSGQAVLLVPAQADAGGRRGQIISLKNAASGKVFRAKITGRDTALLDCNSPETYR